MNLSNIKSYTGNVNLIIQDNTCIFNNGLLLIKFNNNACVEKLIINSINLVDNLHGNKTFYLDCNGGSSVFNPIQLNIVVNTINLAHVYYLQTNFHNSLYVEYHLIMIKGISGIYSYIKIKNLSQLNVELSELRLVYRFNTDLLNKAFNGYITKSLPLYENLESYPKIQDETWQLQDGKYYTKYDLAGYIRETNKYGIYGTQYGAWLINSNHEYYSGGPLKQDLLVHQDSLMLNYLTSSHFGTPNLICKPNWSKLYGPWLIYINNFTNKEDMLDDLNYQTIKEINYWPYSWVNDKLYPLNRFSLQGKITDNIKATIVLNSSLNEEFDKQTLGYTYFANTDDNGYFKINNIRPDNYRISIYPISGYNCELLLTSTISIVNSNQDLGNITLLDNNPKIIWSISQTNRKSDNFLFSNSNRNFIYQLLTPSILDFRIGSSTKSKNWYYAQTKLGSWNIYFNDLNNNLDRILRIGIAATSNSTISRSTIPHLQILFNSQVITNLIYDNDKTIYRSALNSGNFNSVKILIKSSLINTGTNIINLVLKGGSIMYDCLNYSFLSTLTSNN